MARRRRDRKSLREHLSNVVRDIVPYGIDVGIGTLYESVDWADEAIADLISIASGGTGAVPAQAAEEGIDNLAITFTNRLYDIAGDLYQALDLMTPEERRTRDRVIRGASYTERAQIGPADVIPSYIGASVGYYGIRTIRDTRKAFEDLGSWLRENVYKLREDLKQKRSKKDFSSSMA